MISHTFKKVRPDHKSKRRERRGLYVCAICGTETTALTGLIDAVTHLATCGRCIERTEYEATHGW